MWRNDFIDTKSLLQMGVRVCKIHCWTMVGQLQKITADRENILQCTSKIRRLILYSSLCKVSAFFMNATLSHMQYARVHPDMATFSARTASCISNKHVYTWSAGKMLRAALEVPGMTALIPVQASVATCPCC